MYVFTKGNSAKVLKENSCSILREIMKSFFLFSHEIHLPCEMDGYFKNKHFQGRLSKHCQITLKTHNIALKLSIMLPTCHQTKPYS